MNDKDNFHDELTAHLAAQQHPMPYPPKYDHGYVRRDMFIPEPTKPFKDDGLDALGEEPPLEASWPWPLVGAVGVALSAGCAGYLVWQLVGVVMELCK